MPISINYGGPMPSDTYLNYRHRRMRRDARGCARDGDALEPRDGYRAGLRDDPLARRAAWRASNPGPVLGSGSPFRAGAVYRLREREQRLAHGAELTKKLTTDLRTPGREVHFEDEAGTVTILRAGDYGDRSGDHHLDATGWSR